MDIDAFAGGRDYLGAPTPTSAPAELGLGGPSPLSFAGLPFHLRYKAPRGSSGILLPKPLNGSGTENSNPS